MDKISVIIPTYNRAHLILDSINSVLNQTYKNLEIIIVDDGSTDNTEEVVKSINDKRVKYIKYEKNQGACHARNIGIESSTGKYIAFQDSDDIFHEDKLEKQLENLKNNKSDLDFCKIKIIVKDGETTLPTVEREKNIENGKIIDELCNGNFISTQAILAKKNIFIDIKFDESLPRFQDYDLVLRIAKKYKISYTKKELVDLYRQDDSISNSNDKLKKTCVMMIKKEYDLSADNQNRLYSTLLYFGASDEIEKMKKQYVDCELTINKYSILLKDYDVLEKAHKKLISDHNDTLKVFDDLKMNYDALAEKYNNILERNQEIQSELEKAYMEYQLIVNSKRWKFINKFSNIMRKR